MDGEAGTVLLVEDDDDVRHVMRDVLLDEGYRVVEAARASEALTVLRTLARPWVAVIDLRMPDMSGIDILQQIKSNEHSRSIPVVVLTTTDDEREIQKCYDLGANVYITKPVDYEGFATAIRNLGLFFSVIQVP